MSSECDLPLKVDDSARNVCWFCFLPMRTSAFPNSRDYHPDGNFGRKCNFGLRLRITGLVRTIFHINGDMKEGIFTKCGLSLEITEKDYVIWLAKPIYPSINNALNFIKVLYFISQYIFQQ